MKYKKKPVIIEAFQMTKARRLDHTEWPDWLIEAYDKFTQDEWDNGVYKQNVMFPQQQDESNGTDKFMIHTLEGLHLVNWNDWIIRGVQGELYPCKPDIFEMTYAMVD